MLLNASECLLIYLMPFDAFDGFDASIASNAPRLFYNVHSPLRRFPRG